MQPDLIYDSDLIRLTFLQGGGGLVCRSKAGKKRDFSPSSFSERIKTAPYKVGAVTAATDANPTHRRITNEIYKVVLGSN